MCEANQTQVTNVRLLGFLGLYKMKILLFALFFITYIFILIANVLIIILVTTVEQLKIPMFFFLKHLAISDVLTTTVVVPLTLEIILKDEGRVTLIGCITQFFCLCSSSFFQNFLIAAMSYDRYLAVCNPLRYSSLMNSHVFLQLIIGFWVSAVVLESSEIVLVCQSNFCGLNLIDHFFCDLGAFLVLSTSDTSALIKQNIFIAIITILLPLVFIVLTYVYIVFAILKISSHGQRKAFSTCSSHLSMVFAYYGTLIIAYVVPSDENSSMNKYRSLLYVAVCPLLNPIIYSLRHHEIKRSLNTFLAKKLV